jgi:hypothetical protein
VDTLITRLNRVALVSYVDTWSLGLTVAVYDKMQLPFDGPVARKTEDKRKPKRCSSAVTGNICE